MSLAFLILLLQPEPHADSPIVSALPSPPTFAVVSRDHDLPTILDDYRKKTGIKIVLHGKLREGPLGLIFPALTAWEALDRIVEAARARLIPSPDGSFILSPKPLCDAPSAVPSYDCYFRLQPAKISTEKDLNTGSSSCTLVIDLRWLPSLKPLFIDNQAHEVHWKAENGQERVLADRGSSLIPVEGRFHSRIEITLPGMPRRNARIDSLSGRLQAIVPTRFVDFDFPANLSDLAESRPGSAVRRLVREDIVCQLQKVVLEKARWSVQVSLSYPSGSLELESFQAASLVVQNEMKLVHSNRKKHLAPASLVIDQVSSRNALVTYHFLDQETTIRGNPGEWKIEYRAPARIVEVPIRFRFRDIPLP